MLSCGGFVWFTPGFPSQTAAAPASDPVVVRLFYDDIRELDSLTAYDLWEYNNLAAGYILAAVDDRTYASLRRSGFRVAVDEEATARLSNRPAQAETFYEGYRSVAELHADMEALNQAFPRLTELVDYGQSYCLTRGGCPTPDGRVLSGHPLRALRITNENVPGGSVVTNGSIVQGSKPVFFLMANIHAREITTPEIAMRLLDELLVGYGVDADSTWVVDYHEIWVVPTANPDGHDIVRLGAAPVNGGFPFYQRKNANNDGDQNHVADCPVWPPSSAAQFGIDLNRNHSFGWGPTGSSDNPCHLTYRGLAAASEVEVDQLEALVRALIPDQRGPSLDDAAAKDSQGFFITLHSFGNMILWPWGHLSSQAPNYKDLKAIGDRLAFYNDYASCQATSCLYATSGASDDWAYGELGIPAFTFEIGDDFMPPYGEIDGRQWPDLAPALLYSMKISRTPYQTVHGPESSNVIVSGDDSALSVSAFVSDEANGDRPIAGAGYTIDIPPWANGATLQPLAAADDKYDSSRETVTGAITTATLAPGRHILFVQGYDAEGNWGPPSAALFDYQVDRAFMPVLADQ